MVIDAEVPLKTLAKYKRQLHSKVLQTGDSRWTDVFLANSLGDYIGRICPWKECRPGIRQSCEAQHCGRREFLYDDLQVVRLDRQLIAEPPIELWPNPGPIHPTHPVPEDVTERLLQPLKTRIGSGG